MSVLTKTIDKIRGMREERQAKQGTEYRSLVEMLAEGKEPDAMKLERVLRDFGRSEEDLAADVASLARRREARKCLDGAAKVNEIASGIAGLIADADSALERAKSEHRAKVEALKVQQADAAGLLQDIAAARQVLLETAPRELKAKVAELRATISNLANERGALDREADTAQKRIDGIKESLRLVDGSHHVMTDFEQDRAKTNLALLKKEIGDVRSKQAGFTAKITALEAEVKKLEQQMLQII
jgi:hypothetical protein